MSQDVLWTFKYEPKTLKEYIASDEWKQKLKKIIDECPNFILSGPPGVGKSTFMNIFLNETGYDYLKINASMENGIDVIRSKILTFSTTVGMSKFKVVYLNEAERLTQASQEMLRQLMEDVQEHCRFAFVCNSHADIHEAILSRCSLHELNSPPAGLIFNKCLSILKSENIQYDEQQIKKNLLSLIKKLYPDIRRIINALQSSVINSKINDINDIESSSVINQIVDAFFSCDVNEVRKLLRNNSISYPELYAALFENVEKFNYPPEAIILIGEYLWRDKTIAIQEINFIAMMAKMLKENIMKMA